MWQGKAASKLHTHKQVDGGHPHFFPPSLPVLEESMLSHGSGSQVALSDVGTVGGNWTRSCYQGLSSPQSPV